MKQAFLNKHAQFAGPMKGRFPETDDAVFTFFQETHKTEINCIVCFYCTHRAVASFFQNPALGCEYNPHAILIHIDFLPSN
jgi:hypothetical protein